MTDTGTHKRPSAQGENLLRIVVVVYGVALTQSLIKNPDFLVQPLHAANTIPLICLLTAALLASYAYFAYVMAVSQDHLYDVQWTMTNSKWRSSLRFGLDLLLAVLYVRLLLVAASVPAGSGTHGPDLYSFLLSAGIVMAVAAIVRWIRYKHIGRSLPSLLVAVPAIFAAYVWGTRQSRHTDLLLAVMLLVLVLIYIPVSEFVGYTCWKKDVNQKRLPEKPDSELADRLAAVGVAIKNAADSEELADEGLKPLRTVLTTVAKSLGSG